MHKNILIILKKWLAIKNRLKFNLNKKTTNRQLNYIDKV